MKVLLNKKYTWEDTYDLSEEIDRLFDKLDDFPGTITITITHDPKDNEDA